MKFGKFVNKGEGNFEFTNIRKRINIGDNIQSMAIDVLYSRLNVPKEDILECSYCGSDAVASITEPCYLIIQGHFSRQYNFHFMKNPYITPVFLGFALMDSELLPEEIAYMKKYEPILCRDEFTKNVMKKYGVEAYVGGGV